MEHDIRNRGIEASIDHRFSSEWSAFGNYSWQDTPEALDADSGQIPYPVKEIGIPSEHRFNAGLGYSGKTFFGNANVNYASEALWLDVLNAAYAGYTDSYTMLTRFRSRPHRSNLTCPSFSAKSVSSPPRPTKDTGNTASGPAPLAGTFW